MALMMEAVSTSEISTRLHGATAQKTVMLRCVVVELMVTTEIALHEDKFINYFPCILLNIIYINVVDNIILYYMA
jgi:hypothetical protein